MNRYRVEPGDLCFAGLHWITGDNILPIVRKNLYINYWCRACRDAAVAALPPEARGGCPHGFYPSYDCKVCRADRKRNRQRERGAKEQPVGCTPHGWYPARECSECQKRWSEGKRRAKGVLKRPDGCKPHGHIPARECRKCSANYQYLKRIRDREYERGLFGDTAGG